MEAAGGFIINVSSLAGETPLPWLSSYAAAKAGLTFWSEALRIEMSGRITVVTLAPVPSPTGFRAVSGMPERTGDFFREPPELVVRASLSYLKRGGGFCVPGWRHRLMHMLQSLTPRPLALRLMARILRA
jgi:short-subunit dehydrogenase